MSHAPLPESGYPVDDMSVTQERSPAAYSDAAVNLAFAMQPGNYGRGIVICGTGLAVLVKLEKETFR